MGMHILSYIMLIILAESISAPTPSGPSYDQNYEEWFGFSNILTSSQGRDLRLSLTNSTASGIRSKLTYGSGFFHLHIKLPAKDSGGVVTAFYLKTIANVDELDFEFLGNREGKPYTIQTNVFANGKGGREHRIHLWFDPTANYHNYRILWNQYQIVFFVDDYPIRYFKNNRDVGVDYPDQPMRILATIWNGEDWATDGGKTKINWTHAPFEANFRSFEIYGCPSTSYCYSSELWWNREQYRKLSQDQEKRFQIVKQQYVTYDYCDDRPRYPVPPPECLQ